MHTLLSSFGVAMLVILGMAAVLALVLVVLAEVRCLVRLTGQIAAHQQEEPPGFFADVDQHSAGGWS